MLARNTFQPAEKPADFVAPRRVPAAPMQAAGAAARPDRGNDHGRGGESLSGFAKRASRSAAAGWLGLAVALAAAPAHAQGAPAPPSRPWLDPALLPAAKAEGTLIVYSSTNEQEGLPLFRLFTEATGIKVEYVRASDAVLMSRMAIEFRADQKSWDILHTGTINKMPPAMLAPIEPPEAQNIFAEARDPNKRWYGVYANYNAPAYNTQKVKASELPKSYEEFAQRKEWAGKVAIDGTDNEWLKAMLQHYGEQKGTQIVKDIVAALKPVVTDGHLALARATGAGEYWVSLNNYVNLSMNVKLAGNPIEVWALDPVALFFGQVGVNSKAPHPNAARLAANFMLSQECEQFLARFGRLPTRKDVASNPPGIVDMLTAKKVITVLMTPDEDRKWQRQFDQLFRGR
jgi:iron(III) transport system substrate-binding protein